MGAGGLVRFCLPIISKELFRQGYRLVHMGGYIMKQGILDG